MNKTKKLCGYLVLIFLITFYPFRSVVGQINFTLPHPDNNTLEKSTGPFNVVPNTGQINAVIPLVQITSKNIGLEFSLTYANSGIKYQEYAGNVGLGWNLNGGGKITRIVRSYPDDFVRGYIGPGFHGKTIEKAILNNEYLHDNYGGFKQTYDSEPDLYIINTPTFNLEFTFDGDGNIVKKAEDGVIIKPSKYINNTNSNNTSSFIAIDPLGTEYHFSSTLSNRDLTTEKFGSEDITYTSCWHLDKIINAPKSETVYLEYTKYGSTNEIYNYYSWSKQIGVVSSNLETSTQSFNKKYLTKVSAKNGYLKFNYINDRMDIEGGGPRLESITEYRIQNIFVNKYRFDYSYFGSTTTSQGKLSDKCRLRLDKVVTLRSDIDRVGKLFKGFEYKNLNFTYDRKIDQSDYLGYYTTFPTGDPMVNPVLRQPFSLENTSYGQLYKIKEKSGAYNEIIYEHNTFEKLEVNANNILGGLRVKELRSYEGTNPVPKVEKFNYVFNGISSGIVHNILYDNLSYSVRLRPADPVRTTIFSNSLYNINSSLWTYKKVERKLENNSSMVYEYVHYSDSIMDVRLRDNKISTQHMYGLKNSQSNPSRSRTDSNYEYFSGSTVDQGYKRNSLKSLTFFDAQNKIVSKTEYDYVVLNGQKGGYGLHSLVVKMDKTFFAGGGFSGYYFFNESWKLAKEREIQYTREGDSIIFEKEYSYWPSKYLVRFVKTTDSRKMTYTTHSFYPVDYAYMPMTSVIEQGNLLNMYNLNIKNVLIHQRTYLPNGHFTDTHHTFNTPFQLNKTSQLLSKSLFFDDGENLGTVDMYYDAENRLVMQIKSDGEIKSVAYDAYDRVVLEAINASIKPVTSNPNSIVNEFYYNSFENLSFNGSYIGTGSAVTPYAVPFTIPNNKKYLIDYRYFDISSQTWKYEKKRYANSMSITQGSRIDDLRVYPEDAQITTYSYDNYGLKKSETNTNGNTVFYEYDDKYRLVLVMDQNKNIIKSYCYNDAGENIDCYGDIAIR